jgi:hypothetical protein
MNEKAKNFIWKTKKTYHCNAKPHKKTAKKHDTLPKIQAGEKRRG